MLVFYGTCLFAQSITYQGILRNETGAVIANLSLNMVLKICRDASSEECLYSETLPFFTSAEGHFSIEIGAGKTLSGDFSSINWSDGAYYLHLMPDTPVNKTSNFLKVVQLRAETELKPGNLEGMATADTAADCGTVVIRHNKHQLPKKVTVDLTSSYVNLRYPADTYPIYRHFEWVDENRDGKGNALEFTFSENTRHAFFENSDKLGEVKLYPKAFQELYVRSGANELVIKMDKPFPIENVGQTYAIKGPWKLIYYIEW